MAVHHTVDLEVAVVSVPCSARRWSIGSISYTTRRLGDIRARIEDRRPVARSPAGGRRSGDQPARLERIHVERAPTICAYASTGDLDHDVEIRTGTEPVSLGESRPWAANIRA